MNNQAVEHDKCENPGCNGILKDDGTERGCQCHQNPPCSHCENAWERLYCPECSWSAEEDESFIPNTTIPEA